MYEVSNFCSLWLMSDIKIVMDSSCSNHFYRLLVMIRRGLSSSVINISHKGKVGCCCAKNQAVTVKRDF